MNISFGGEKKETHREEIKRLLKVLLIVGLEGGSPSFEFSFERHGLPEMGGVPDAEGGGTKECVEEV